MILVNLEIFVNKGISGYSKESFDFGESGGPCDYGDSCSLSDSGNCKEVHDFGESGESDGPVLKSVSHGSHGRGHIAV